MMDPKTYLSSYLDLYLVNISLPQDKFYQQTTCKLLIWRYHKEISADQEPDLQYLNLNFLACFMNHILVLMIWLRYLDLYCLFYLITMENIVYVQIGLKKLLCRAINRMNASKKEKRKVDHYV